MICLSNRRRLMLVLVVFSFMVLGFQTVYADDCVESCDSVGNTKDQFNIGDNVYFKASGLIPGATYTYYIIPDFDPWSPTPPGIPPSCGYPVPGQPIPPGIILPPWVATGTIIADPLGFYYPIPGSPAWSNPLTPGGYDIWLDYINPTGAPIVPPEIPPNILAVNGVYSLYDHLDNMDVGLAQFFVVPELPLGTFSALASFLCAAYVKYRK